MKIEVEIRMMNGTIINQGMPKIVGAYQKLGRGKEGFFSKAFLRSLYLLTSNFWPPEL